MVLKHTHTQTNITTFKHKYSHICTCTHKHTVWKWSLKLSVLYQKPDAHFTSSHFLFNFSTKLKMHSYPAHLQMSRQYISWQSLTYISSLIQFWLKKKKCLSTYTEIWNDVVTLFQNMCAEHSSLVVCRPATSTICNIITSIKKIKKIKILSTWKVFQ